MFVRFDLTAFELPWSALALLSELWNVIINYFILFISKPSVAKMKWRFSSQWCSFIKKAIPGFLGDLN